MPVKNTASKVVIVLALFVWNNCPAQVQFGGTQPSGISYNSLKQLVFPAEAPGSFKAPVFSGHGFPVLGTAVMPVWEDANVQGGDPLLEIQNEPLPFFCRMEHQLSLKTALPFKFRLGSVDYVDWLEGKPNAISPR